jgi:hypothetical protein
MDDKLKDNYGGNYACLHPEKFTAALLKIYD